MSRFEECDDYDEEYNNAWALREQATRNALKGRRGQAILKEIISSLERLPKKRLIRGSLAKNGQVCVLGALALKRRQEAGEKVQAVLAWMEETVGTDSDATDTALFAEANLGVCMSLAYRLALVNDEWGDNPDKETPEERYERVLVWVQRQLNTSNEGSVKS